MATRPGEKVILVFNKRSPKWYGIVHLNKHDPNTTCPLERIISGNILLASYRIEGDSSGGSVIGKRYDVKKRVRDVLVVPKGSPIEEKLYNLALKEAKAYAGEKGLEFEDQTTLKLEPKPI